MSLRRMHLDVWDVLQEAMGGPEMVPEWDLLALAKAVAKRMKDLEQALEAHDERHDP
jgi:hypothetical protein